MASQSLRQGRFTLLAAGSALAVIFLASSAVAQPSVPEPPPPAEPWYEAVKLRAFADAYFNLNLGFPKPQSYKPPTRSFDAQTGFALSWVGLDAAYDPDPVGGVVSLRFGPTARRYAGADEGIALEYVKQAYASWKPGGADGMLTLDFGKFDTFVGAEVADSQDNFNYTRGILYSFAQPNFHTGLRASAELVPELTLTAMVANGWNRSLDNNIGKTYGLQASITPSPAFSASIAWIGGPEQDDFTTTNCAAGTAYDPGAGTCTTSAGAPAQEYVVDRGGANEFDAWRHLFDLVLSIQPLDNLAFVLNADYGVEGVRPDDTSIDAKPESQHHYGGALFARLQLDEVWAIAGRGEYLNDPDGHALQYKFPSGEKLTDAEVATGTLTFEARPTDNLILRLEGRGDFVLKGKPDEEIYREKSRDTSKNLYTATLGVVVTTN
jgi:hypothetical protein